MIGTSLVEAAERIARGRRLRNEIFSGLCDGFGEPSWDMMLRLFIERERGEGSTPAGVLIEAAMVPRQTAEAYLGYLASHHIVAIDLPEPWTVVRGVADDVGVRLEGRGRELMLSYLEQERTLETVP